MKVAIYGAGGTGKMIVDKLRTDLSFKADLIFVDDTPGLTTCYGLDVYSFEQACRSFACDALSFFIAVGDPAQRKMMAERVREADFHFESWIHPDAFVSPSAEIGEGVFIDACAIDSNVIIGSNTLIYRDALIGHDTQVGDNSIINARAFIGGSSVLENEVYFGPCAACRDEIHVGCGTIIGLGAAVYKDVPDGCTAIGNPARIVRRGSDKIFA